MIEISSQVTYTSPRQQYPPCRSNRRVDLGSRVARTTKLPFRSCPVRDATAPWRDRVLIAHVRVRGSISWMRIAPRRRPLRHSHWQQPCSPTPRPPCKYKTKCANNCVARSRAAEHYQIGREHLNGQTHLENGKTHVQHMLTRRAKLARLGEMFQRRGELASDTMMLSKIPMRHLRGHRYQTIPLQNALTHPNTLLDHVVRIRLELDLQPGLFRQVLLVGFLDPRGVDVHDVPGGRQAMALGERCGAGVRTEGGLDEGGVAKTVDVGEREFKGLWGDGRTRGDDGDESVYGCATCVCGVSTRRTRRGGCALAGVAGDVGVEIERVCIVDGACLSSSGRVLVRNFRVDRVHVHHVGDKTTSRDEDVRSVGVQISHTLLIYGPLIGHLAQLVARTLRIEDCVRSWVQLPQCPCTFCLVNGQRTSSCNVMIRR